MKNIGGQAVIEGVMMKTPGNWSVAVRDQRGEIHLKIKPLRKLPGLLRLPLLRGVVALFQALSIGIKALEFSADKAYDEKEKPLTPLATVLTIGLAILLGICVFVLLPLYITKLIGLAMPAASKSSLAFNFIDGILRVMVFLIYVVAIGLWKDMERIFEYHGAEHKVIHAYEAGKELTPVNVRPFSTLHPRCGTSFLLIVMTVSIFIFSFIPQSWPFWSKFFARLTMMPLIAGVSFELLKLSAAMKDNPAVNFLLTPGLMLQKLTTREPDDLQIEVAIAAIKEALSAEGTYVR